MYMGYNPVSTTSSENMLKALIGIIIHNRVLQIGVKTDYFRKKTQINYGIVNFHRRIMSVPTLTSVAKI